MFSISGLALAKLTATALVVSLSPVPVVVALILLIHNERPRSSSIAYLLGRIVSLLALTTVFVNAPRLLDDLNGPTPAWADWIVVTIGIALVTLGIRLWWQRTTTVNRTRWDGQARKVTPAVSAALGMFPVLANPKVLAASAAAGIEISTLGVTDLGAAVAVAYYAVLANCAVAAPILAYLAVGSRIDPRLERLRQWLHDRHQVMAAGLLIVVGVAVALYGFS
ncbi:hypothetical protein A5653_23340 [Mycobacterium colombiense]|uniref:GAP family protein n=1 Tax=Mycobacterium colombiense TaxID=339268 RepID=UPI0007EFF778|nr:GAP family protein [Mycobacterium colombiense]OBK64284.1 hypothetical protein A5653_23340 [Mycobacterium colombiense]